MIAPSTMAVLIATIDAVRADMGDDDADLALRADMLEGASDMHEIASRLVRAAIRARADATGAHEAGKAAVAHYDRRQDIAERNEAAAKKMLATIMAAADLTRLALPEGKVSMSPGRVSLSLAADFKPPQGYERTKIEPDKTAIKAALESGETMPGAELRVGEPIIIIR